MSRDHVGHAEIAKFGTDKVNLPKDKADKFRAQARNLREKLEGYLKDHPDFALRKMLLSGSLAKGTGLRTLNDIDVGCYISGSDVPSDIDELMEYLAERLRKAFPNFKPEQVQPKTYCVTVSFLGSGLDVDIVDLSRFDAAPLIAFTATKEMNYGTETDGRIPPRCGAYCTNQWANAQAGGRRSWRRNVDAKQVDYPAPRHRRGVERGFRPRPRE